MVRRFLGIRMSLNYVVLQVLHACQQVLGSVVLILQVLHYVQQVLGSAVLFPTNVSVSFVEFHKFYITSVSPMIGRCLSECLCKYMDNAPVWFYYAFFVSTRQLQFCFVRSPACSSTQFRVSYELEEHTKTAPSTVRRCTWQPTEK